VPPPTVLEVVDGIGVVVEELEVDVVEGVGAEVELELVVVVVGPASVVVDARLVLVSVWASIWKKTHARKLDRYCLSNFYSV